MTHQITGYHGTSYESAKKILSSDYQLSIGDNEWLGNGAYFFIHGISSKPEDQAHKWAIASAWDKKLGKYAYPRYSVMKSTITVHDDDFLDLTKEDGVNVLLYLVDRYKNKLNKTFKQLDGLIINLARGEGILPIDVVKGNFYIKFAPERKMGINLRTANSTICTVYDPKKNISGTVITSIGEVL